ncbi:hypothetical protein HHL11_06940 [Ramlibacter sp. G-1-2-2]|uniref:Uncharacterized protein n=1 Tax=Ramlibacter agri TaxID=2728837 RepID=A0A848H1U1_9BURK|nr:hypothetical protein [Ramlibacter agri]NML43479.1 hypothetical protein [Ramlibacter agri]
MKPQARFLRIIDRAVATMRRARWPARLAGVFCLTAAVLFVAASLTRADAEQISRRAATLNRELTAARRTAPAADEASRLATYAADGDQHVDDVRDVFQLAERFDVSLLTAQYDAPDRSAGNLVVRRVRLSAHDEYPQVKLLLQAILSNAPHAYISDLRLDRPDATKREINATFTLAFVYRGGERLP